MKDYYVQSKHFIGNANTEVVMLGRDLKPGMVVMVGQDYNRAEIKPRPTEKDIYDQNMTNRWCEVRDINKTYFEGKLCELIFTGVYADETIMPRTAAADQTWYVKKDTLPGFTYQERRANYYSQVLEFIKDTIDSPILLEDSADSITDMLLAASYALPPETSEI